MRIDERVNVDKSLIANLRILKVRAIQGRFKIIDVTLNICPLFRRQSCPVRIVVDIPHFGRQATGTLPDIRPVPAIVAKNISTRNLYRT